MPHYLLYINLKVDFQVFFLCTSLVFISVVLDYMKMIFFASQKLHFLSILLRSNKLTFTFISKMEGVDNITKACMCLLWMHLRGVVSSMVFWLGHLKDLEWARALSVNFGTRVLGRIAFFLVVHAKAIAQTYILRISGRRVSNIQYLLKPTWGS